MKKKRKTFRKSFIMSILGITIFLCSMLLGVSGMTAWAEEEDSQFIIDAQLLPSDKPTYDIQLTVENLGDDWEGTVRLKVVMGYGSGNNCAYDTALSLPQGSTKQFVVRISKESVDRTDGTVKVILLDKKSEKSAEKKFARLLQDSEDALSMGILSDRYASLTYLDMGGNELYYGDRNRPIKLVQLKQGSLAETLDTLTFLVIDSYDTTALTDEEISSIEHWMDNGGALIVGTGDYAEKTLGGLDFLDISYREVVDVRGSVLNWDYYVDISKLSMMELEDNSGTFNNQYLQLGTPWGFGAVSVLPCALTELGRLDADAYTGTTQEGLVEEILDNASAMTDSRYQTGQTSSHSVDYMMKRIFPNLGKGNNRLQFGGLKILVILYVIFVGPLLYLILRALKKRDFYWIAVPVATLVGIFLIYWAGRGFQVADTNVYSVTVEELSKKGNAVTYLRCYDAGHKEWALQLAQGYEYADSLIERYYDDEDDGYYYHIRKEGERLFVGMNPTAGFEDGYFWAGMEKEPEAGTISWDGDKTVTNGTQYDFAYFAVIMNDNLLVYKDLPAGESFNLEEEKCEFVDEVTIGSAYNTRYSSYYSPTENYYYNYLRDSLRSDEKTDMDIDVKAALGMGVSYACFQMKENQAVIVGVTKDWKKAVDDNCSEVSYGCLYTVME